MATSAPLLQGDFTGLAKNYHHRAGYSLTVLSALASHVGAGRDGFIFADVGAGTGKHTENLLEMGLSGYAVEPNDAMREEGERRCHAPDRLAWSNGQAESTGLPSSSVRWVLMGSSFHWADPALAIPEFHRILKPDGFLSVLWNPRDLEKSILEQRIEKQISRLVPELRRVSSGGAKYTQGLEEKLTLGGYFDDVIFMEAPHQVMMDKGRYRGLWQSVNDVRAQAGEARFKQILQAIEQ